MSNKSLQFHIESNDYFGTLATALSFIKQTVNDKKFCNINKNNLEEIEQDLIFLQREYRIIKK